MQNPRAPNSDPALVTGRLNVPDYVAARQDDIRLLEKLVNSAGSKAKKRAFQSLPRTERRRAASHDARRVPRKHGLRKRAELENLHANAKKPKSSVRPRPPPQKPHIPDRAAFDTKATLPADGSGVRFANRQRNKIWLPTHIWHKKRAFLERMGEFIVPVTATQKQYRRTHRLLANIDEHGIMAWDTSYDATIIVQIPSDSAAEADVLLNLKFPGAPSPLYKAGSKHWQGLFDNKGPTIVHWASPATFAVVCHPFLFDKVWETFAASVIDFHLQDARFAIGSIDLLGPGAPEVLADTLLPCPAPFNGNTLLEQWDRIGSTCSQGGLPSRLVFQYFAKDPRLFGKRFKRHGSPPKGIFSLDQRASMALYDPKVREESLTALLLQSAVDLRKIEPVKFDSAADARIPISVLALDDGRLRIMLPRQWVLPTWLTIFKRKHAMIGGQKELHQLAFESRCPYFPSDFPSGLDSLRNSPNNSSDGPAACKHTSFVRDVAKNLNRSDIAHIGPEALAIARIEVISRGTPETGATIYAVEQDEADLLIASKTAIELPEKLEGEILGLVTTGGFNLVRAKGTGVGLLKASSAKAYSKSVCLIKNDAHSNVYWPAFYDLIRPDDISRVMI